MDVQIDEAQSHGMTILEYAPSCRGAEMFKSLAHEIVSIRN
jgi:cellulose biosynthesis protein BcsQ